MSAWALSHLLEVKLLVTQARSIYMSQADDRTAAVLREQQPERRGDESAGERIA